MGIMGMVESLKANRKLVAILILAAVLRFSFMSIGLDDFDSFYFVRALEHFDPPGQAPHSPYNLVYYAFAKLFFLFSKDYLLSLILPSVIFGALIVLPVYFAAKKMIGDDYALPAAILAAVSPLLWLKSEIAMGDMTAAFFIVSAICVLLWKEKKYFFELSSLLFALSLAGRPINILFIFLIPFLLGFKRDLLRYMGFLALFSLIWFIPLSVSFGSPLAYANSFFADVTIVTGSGTSSDIIFAADAPYSPLMGVGLFGYLFSYLNAFNPVVVDTGSLLSLGPTENIGMGAVLQSVSPDYLGMLGLALIILLLAGNFYTEKQWLAVIWLIPYALWFVLMQTPYNIRYVLPLIPALILLVVNGLRGIYSKFGVRALAVFFLLLLCWGIRGFEVVRTINTEPAPPLQAISYFEAEDFGGRIYGYGDEPFYTFYAPGLDYVKVDYRGQGLGEIAPASYVDLRVLNYLGMEGTDCVYFRRNPMAHFKHSMITLCKVE